MQLEMKCTNRVHLLINVKVLLALVCVSVSSAHVAHEPVQNVLVLESDKCFGKIKEP